MTRRILIALALYVVLGACLPGKPVRSGWTARVTWYRDSGITASGEWTHEGGAGCSYDLPLGTVVHFVGTNISVVCNDRGYLSPTWVDVFAPSGWPAAVLGDWAEIETW